MEMTANKNATVTHNIVIKGLVAVQEVRVILDTVVKLRITSGCIRYTNTFRLNTE